MKCPIGAAALLVVTANAAFQEDGNWYDNCVDSITYTSVGASDAYTRVTQMDSSSGTCSGSSYDYSGSLAPLNEEVSIHVRGPVQLKRFGSYTPGTGSSKKMKRDAHVRRHAHAHGHGHAHQHEKRAVGDMVYATIDGEVVSWRNEWTGEATTSDAAPASYSTPSADSNSGSAVLSASTPSASSDSSSIVDAESPNTWVRNAYYEAGSKKDGLVFLNHYGGSGSGVFDYQFGNSLAFASANGQSGASSPQMLDDCDLPSNQEVVIMTDDKCSDDECGYFRPGTADVAYHGFGGDNKAFFFEFMMPSSENDGAADNVNMPAIWSLNAQIPRTLQYGKAECSCWTTGCGEFDIFEVLSSGSSKMKSTMHGNKAGGSSDYFERPFNTYVKGALIMSEDTIQVTILPNGTTFDFPESLTKSDLQDILDHAEANSIGTSRFNLAGASSG